MQNEGCDTGARAWHGADPLASFEAMYADCYNALVRYCRRFGPDGTDPEDLAQEAFAHAWSAWEADPPDDAWAWLATIARRLCTDRWRRNQTAASRQDDVIHRYATEPIQPEDWYDVVEALDAALTAFAALPQRDRRVVFLRQFDRKSYDDIARSEGLTVDTVRGVLRRARRSLRTTPDTPTVPE